MYRLITTFNMTPLIMRLNIATSSVGIFFCLNLCYFAPYEKHWVREEDHLGDFARAKRFQNLVGRKIAMDVV